MLPAVTPRVDWDNLTDKQKTQYKNTQIRQRLAHGEDISGKNDEYFKDLWDKAQKENQEKSDKARKKYNDIIVARGTDREMLPHDESEALSDLFKQTRNMIILQDMSERFQRRQIVRLEEEKDRPLDEGDLDAALDGNTEAESKIEEAVREDEEKTPTPTPETPEEKHKGTKVEDDSFKSAIDDARKKVTGAEPPKEPKHKITTGSLAEMFEENGVAEVTPETPEEEGVVTPGGPEEAGTVIIPETSGEVQPEEPEEKGVVATPTIPGEVSVPETPGEVQPETSIDDTEVQPGEPAGEVSVPDTSEDESPVGEEGNDTTSSETGDSIDVSIADTPDVDEKYVGHALWSLERQGERDDKTQVEYTPDQGVQIQPVDQNVQVEYTPDQGVQIQPVDPLDVSGLEFAGNGSERIVLNGEEVDVTGENSEEQSDDGGNNDRFTISTQDPFFYNPFASDTEEIVTLKANGVELFTDKHRATARQFAEKLSTPGWFGRVNTKFYVVSGNNDKSSDKLTVALIFVDPDDTNTIYTTTLRSLSSKHFKQGYYGGKEIDRYMADVLMENVNRELYENDDFFNNSLSVWVTLFNVRHNTNYTVNDFQQKEPDSYLEFIDDLRQKCRIKGRPNPLTREQAKERLLKFAALRNSIIEQYCTKNDKGEWVVPTTPRTDVVPMEVHITNGRFNNRDEYRPIYGEQGGFGFGESIDDIDDDITNGNVEIGVGTGPLGETPYAIRPFVGQNDEMKGRGRAGKLYIKVPVTSQPAYDATNSSSPRQCCVQLNEKRFKGPGPLIEEIIEESFDESGKITDATNPPSLAEIAFRLITGTIDTNSIVLRREGGERKTIDNEMIKMLSNLLINHGTKTLLGFVKYLSNGEVEESSMNQLLCRRLGFYNSKQIAFVEHEDGSKWFYIGDAENGIPFLHKYKLGDLFPGENATPAIKEKAAENRKHVICLIANNMHWNTNIDDIMLATLGDLGLQDMLDMYFFDESGERRLENGKPVTTFSPFGNPDFSFEFNDFYNQDGSAKDNTVMSWMIKTGKINTDVGTSKDDMFYAPFVYATGVKSTQPTVQNPVDVAHAAEAANVAGTAEKKGEGAGKKGMTPKAEEKPKEQEPKDDAKKVFTLEPSYEKPSDPIFEPVTVDKNIKNGIYLLTAEPVGKNG